MKKIQIFSTAEDERLRISEVLTKAGFQISAEASYGEAQSRIRSFRPDAVVIVYNEPAVHALITRLREISLVPFLVIGLLERNEVVNVLESGADRYLAQPFCSQELIARVKAILRNNETYTSSVIEAALLDELLQSNNVFAELTPKEYHLFSCLLNGKGQIIPFKRLLMEVWQGKTSIDTLHYHARRLKEKLDGNKQCPYRLQSYRGEGYCLHKNSTTVTYS
jgi:DNA-binding response OmpR family regulator